MNYKIIKQNKNKKILVILHLFYMDSWNSIKYYLQNLSPYKYDLIVTYTDDFYEQKLLDEIADFHINTKFYKYENRGFDIGPFIDIISKTDLNRYDIIYKLHSKGIERPFIYIYNQIFKYTDWFANLYKAILGEFSVHHAINILSKNTNIGIVAAENLIVEDPIHKKYFTQQIAKYLDLRIPDNYHYVAGSCFVIKSDLLNYVKKLNLTIKDFEKTSRGEFSFAHAMERIMFACIEDGNEKMYGISVRHPMYKSEVQKYEKISSLRLLKDKSFDLNYEFFYKCLEGKNIKSYEIKAMKLKEIKRNWFGKIYSLTQCSPYKYLKGDKLRYEKYTKINAELTSFKMSTERFDALIKSIEKNGFNTRYLPVVNANDNSIMDGLHRCSYLLNKYGENHKVKVLYLKI
ncbi:MAG: hypothetical protein IKO06_05585 [Alphaproteobacteria bacterium]|nr:hypothetical protein [Alphaproteobacteria bacterium]